MDFTEKELYLRIEHSLNSNKNDFKYQFVREEPNDSTIKPIKFQVFTPTRKGEIIIKFWMEKTGKFNDTMGGWALRLTLHPINLDSPLMIPTMVRWIEDDIVRAQREINS